jgi:glycosyltransferase involved in cell wall biosynthesis
MPHYIPKVSIVIPVYNGSDYMRDAIDSALAQTYKNIEIIVINDGSNDVGKTREIALSYGDKIRYFEKENGGVATALNLGIEKMIGDYFSWLSHDDRYLPEKIELQIKYLQKYSQQRIILFTNYYTINSKGKKVGAHIFDHQMLQNKPLYPLLRGCVHGCSLLIPREAFDTIGRFDKLLRTTQDYDLWYRMIRKYPFIHMQDVLVESRWHENQGSKTLPETLIEANRLWISMMDKCSVDERIAHEGSSYLFYLKCGKFLENTPYICAKNHAFTKAEEFFKNTTVSIIIPCYNRVEWACEAIASAQCQTFSNIEIIVVDDGSTENMDSIIALADGDSRIRYFRRENSGASAARNFGISNASGQYIAFLDADDLFEKNKIEYQLRRMLEEDVSFSYTSYLRFGRDKDIMIINSGKFHSRSLPEITSLCQIATPTVMVRKDIIKEKLNFLKNLIVEKIFVFGFQ